MAEKLDETACAESIGRAPILSIIGTLDHMTKDLMKTIRLASNALIHCRESDIETKNMLIGKIQK